MAQLSPIMQQLAGVDLEHFLRDISRLPGAMAKGMCTETPKAATDELAELETRASSKGKKTEAPPSE